MGPAFPSRSGAFENTPGSVQSNRSWLTQQLSKVLKARNSSTDAEVQIVKYTFSLMIIGIVVLGIVLMVLQRSIGHQLLDVSNELFMSGDQAL